jgi:hypothetical protein
MMLTQRLPRRVLAPSSFFKSARMLLVGVLLAVLRFGTASADLLTLMVNATNAPKGALDKAQEDAAALLERFVSMEGASYTAVAPGQAVPGPVRMLLLRGDSERADAGPPLSKWHDDASGNDVDPVPGDARNRNLGIDCPNQCSDSGSYTCRFLGCAHCGRCNRRQRLLQGSRNYNNNNKQRKIESELSGDLSAYCHGKPGCSIRAVIQRVNDDGSLTLAV